MDTCYSFKEFTDKGYVVDIEKYLISKMDNIAQKNDKDDILQHYFLKCIDKKIVEKFDPSKGMKFSSYMFMTFKSFVLSYYGKLSKREYTFRTAAPMDELLLFEGNKNTTLSDILPDTKVSFFADSLERKKIYTELSLRSTSHKCRLNIPLHRLYEFIVRGYSSKEVADEVGCSVAHIGNLSKRLVTTIRSIQRN